MTPKTDEPTPLQRRAEEEAKYDVTIPKTDEPLPADLEMLIQEAKRKIDNLPDHRVQGADGGYYIALHPDAIPILRALVRDATERVTRERWSSSRLVHKDQWDAWIERALAAEREAEGLRDRSTALDKAVEKFLTDASFTPPWESAGSKWAMLLKTLNEALCDYRGVPRDPDAAKRIKTVTGF